MFESCNQIVLTNGRDEYILKIPVGYYTFNEFCEAIAREMNKYVDIAGLIYKDEYIGMNTMNTTETWWFDRESVNTTIDGCEWTRWFKMDPVKIVVIERTDEWMERMDMHFLRIHIWNMTG